MSHRFLISLRHRNRGVIPISQLDQDATIYQYQLVRKVRYIPLANGLYALLPLAALIWFAVGTHWQAAAAIPATLAGLPCVYSLIAMMHWRMQDQPRRKLKWFIHFPWIGALPAAYTSFRAILRLHLHIGWIALACIALFVPWFPAETVAAAAFVHIWYMLPRVVLLVWFAGARHHNQHRLFRIAADHCALYVE